MRAEGPQLALALTLSPVAGRHTRDRRASFYPPGRLCARIMRSPRRGIEIGLKVPNLARPRYAWICAHRARPLNFFDEWRRKPFALLAIHSNALRAIGRAQGYSPQRDKGFNERPLAISPHPGDLFAPLMAELFTHGSH